MRIKPKSFFLIFILLLMVYAACASLSFGHYEALLAPLLLSLTILVLGAIELVRELRTKEEKPLAVEEEDAPPTVVASAQGEKDARRFFMALGWIGGFALGIYVLGFFLSSFLFAASYLKVRGYHWSSATIFAVCFAGALYLVFDVGFSSHLYRGLVFGG